MPATLDALAGERPLVILAETYLPVVFDLLVRPGTTLAELPRGHPSARRGAGPPLAAVRAARRPGRRWSARPRRRPQAVADGRVRRGGRTGGRRRAVRAGQPGPRHRRPPRRGDPVRAAGPAATTARRRPATTGPAGRYLRADHAGALLEILTEFATRGVNLTRIESRPTKGRLGQYCFSIDCEGHLADARVGDALAALHRVCADVRYLGSYPRRGREQAPVPTGRADPDFTERPAGWPGSTRPVRPERATRPATWLVEPSWSSRQTAARSRPGCTGPARGRRHQDPCTLLVGQVEHADLLVARLDVRPPSDQLDTRCCQLVPLGRDLRMRGSRSASVRPVLRNSI